MQVRLTDREADVMAVLWQLGSATVSEVREALADELAYTTVLTILRTLEGKGYVDHSLEGRAHRYVPAVSQEKARRSASSALVDKLFKGSAALLLTHLVTDRRLSQAEIRRIRHLLDDAPTGDDGPEEQ